MGKVHVLSSETINRIAAGEVIERPASAVKELVENAIDSGATRITVEAEQGGISLLRVSDNGSGFATDDIRTAFLRHATSKINDGNDLFRIHSLGFRGEALSSIAAVAKVELLTYNAEDYLGTRYVIEGGEEVSFEEAGCPQGSTIIVRDLFYNVPVRRAFLRTPVTETGYINELLCRIAIAHPEVSFTFISQGRTVMHTSGNGKLKDAVYAIYGREIANNLVPVKGEANGLTIGGMIGKPIICRSNRNCELCFVNGRDIKSNLLAKAIEDAYQGYMMQHKYPFTCMSIEIAPEVIDVNVHPTKSDVRFSDADAVYNAVYEAVRNALSDSLLIHPAAVSEDETPQKVSIPRPPESFEENRIAISKYTEEKPPVIAESVNPEPPASSASQAVCENETKFTAMPVVEEFPVEDMPEKAPVKPIRIETEEPVHHPQNKPSEETTDPFLVPKETVPTPTPQEQIVKAEQLSFMEKSDKVKFRVIGQVFNTYWMIELDNELLMIDQHAAHEKINYERLLAQVKAGDVYMQQVMPPQIVSLTIREEEALQANAELFEKLGFEFRDLGGREYGICSVPTVMFGIPPKDYIHETLDRLTETSRTQEPLLAVLERLATMSCKAAIKGGQAISQMEAEHLIDELLTLDNPYHCPHGRPIIISFSKYDLEKKFKRIV